MSVSFWSCKVWSRATSREMIEPCFVDVLLMF